MKSVLTTIVLVSIAAMLPATSAAATGKLVAKMQGEGTKQNGAVRLTQSGASLLVEIRLSNASGKTEPAMIHHGSCSKIGAVVHALTNVVGGTSTTTVSGLTLRQIRAGTYAVLVHASPTDLTRYVSCGDIGRGAHLSDDASFKGFGGRAGQ